MSEMSSENSELFDVLRTLTATGVQGYRNSHLIKSGHETSGSCHTNQSCNPADTIRDSQSKFEKKKKKNTIKVWSAAPLCNPINLYLGDNRM